VPDGRPHDLYAVATPPVETPVADMAALLAASTRRPRAHVPS
jgi:hypothetical protein